eukprot:SAG11_NODE_6458_length_1309_cov_1.430579_1_plen_30_part_01
MSLAAQDSRVEAEKVFLGFGGVRVVYYKPT